MESIHWMICLFTAAVLLISTLLLLRHRRKNLSLPPGPKPWPIIGNLNLIGPLPHRSIHQLTLKYGPIMQLKFGSFSVVVGSSVEMAKVFLKTMDANFVDRPKLAAGKYTTYNYSNVTWSPYGAYWRQARKMWLIEIFSARRLDSFEFIRVEELNSFLVDLFNSAGSPVTLKDHLSTLSFNIISRMVLGKRYTDKDEDSTVLSQEFKEMLDEFFLLNGVFTIGDSIPWLAFLDLDGYVKRMKVLAKKFDKFLENVLDEHIARRSNYKENSVTKDMMDVLLELADNSNLEIKLERHSVKAFTQDLLAGGTDTSTVTLEWALSEMLKKPETFKKAQEELDRVVGSNRWVQEKDMLNLPYIEAIAKETMRMHPVAPMLVPRESIEDCKVAGYDIPRGTRVLVNVWSIGRDPTLWDEPEQFEPNRFIGKLIDVKGRDFELLPFGAGRRMCPGYNLGLKVIHTCLANLLHGYRWSFPKGVSTTNLNMDEIFGLTTRKKIPLVVVVEPRLPHNLYHMLSNK